MKRINRLWLGVGASIGVIELVAGATLGATTLLGVTFEESEPKPAEGVQTENVATTQPKSAEGVQTDGARADGEGAKVERYPGVAICVQAVGVDSAIEAVGKARIETALLQVQQHRHWNISGRGVVPPLVDIGCPQEPLPTHPGIAWKDAEIIGGTGTIYTVPEPGFYSEYLFIMPLEQIDALLGGLSIRVAPQEYVAESDDEIAERASATYIAPDELDDIGFLTKQLTIAVGLEDRYPEPSPE